MAQESEAKESFGQLEMLQRTHDKLRSRADQLEAVHDRLFSKLEIVKKTLMVSNKKPVLYAYAYYVLCLLSQVWVCEKPTGIPTIAMNMQLKHAKKANTHEGCEERVLVRAC